MPEQKLYHRAIAVLRGRVNRSGLARIHKVKKDARRLWINVTAKGERVLQEARRRRIQVLAERLADLDREGLMTLRRAAELMEQVAPRASATD